MRLAVFFAALTLHAQTADQVIARNIKARGGAARLAALQSQSLTGTLAFAPNPGEPFHAEMKRPGKLRQEISLNHDRFTQVTNGMEGWTLRANAAPEPMSAQQLKDLAGSADMEGPLFRYKEKGNRVEFAGKEKVEGRDAYKLIIAMKDGTSRTDYIDAKTYLELKWEGTVGGQKMESYFHSYRKVKGLAYAFDIDSSGPGFKQKLLFTTIEVNIDLPDSHFTKP
jgi:hypothetical protein